MIKLFASQDGPQSIGDFLEATTPGVFPILNRVSSNARTAIFGPHPEELGH
jgi:hypothetical protein